MVAISDWDFELLQLEHQIWHRLLSLKGISRHGSADSGHQEGGEEDFELLVQHKWVQAG